MENPRTSIRGALSPARCRRGTTRCTGLCGSDGLGTSAPREHKALADPNAIRLYRGRAHLYFWSDRGIPTADVLEAETSLTK